MALTITQKVYRYIKDAIVRGRYAAGDWLQETQIATELGVSRSPVREALRLLVGDGFLVQVPNKGIFVRAFQEKELHNIFELRFCMEEIGVRASVGKVTEEIATHLQDIIVQMREAMEEGDVNRYGELDFDLHTCIVALSGNEIYSEVYRNYNHLLTPFRVFCIADPERAAHSMEEHTRMVNSLISGDVDTAVETCRYHLIENSKVALEYIMATRANTATTGRTLGTI